MALEIIDKKIVGTVDKLEDKLDGKLPVDILELLILVNSWGRTDFFYTEYLNEDIRIEKCEVKECYDLSKLDVSKITNMSNVFICSKFNGDISSWNMSSVTDMSYMFYKAENFNQQLNNWITSNVIHMNGMFSNGYSFNQNISNWKLDKVKTCNYMFFNSKAFINKYNNGEELPNDIKEFKTWFNKNKVKMNEINVKNTHGEEIDDFFSKFEINQSLFVKK